jgi:hypothetical protein
MKPRNLYILPIRGNSAFCHCLFGLESERHEWTQGAESQPQIKARSCVACAPLLSQVTDGENVSNILRKSLSIVIPE